MHGSRLDTYNSIDCVFPVMHPYSSTTVQYPFYEYVYLSNIQLTNNWIDVFTVSHVQGGSMLIVRKI